MECEKVRDRFSSLSENELDPTEEKALREHLSVCPDCEKDLQAFERTIRWLHSVEDAEAPDGFLNEINKKMEERKRKSPFFSISLRLPAQALAMVMIVFVVLYITKIMPVERLLMKEAKHTKPFISEPLREEKKADQRLAKKEIENERVDAQPSFKEIEKSRIPAAETVPAPSKKDKMEVASAEKEKVSPAAKPSQEIVLRTLDREKTRNEIEILLQQFKGKMISAEEDLFVAALPAATFPQFEKELLKLSPSGKPDKMVREEDMAGGEKVPAGARTLRREKNGKRLLGFAAEPGDYVVVRVILLQE